MRLPWDAPSHTLRRDTIPNPTVKSIRNYKPKINVTAAAMSTDPSVCSSNLNDETVNLNQSKRGLDDSACIDRTLMDRGLGLSATAQRRGPKPPTLKSPQHHKTRIVDRRGK